MHPFRSEWPALYTRRTHLVPSSSHVTTAEREQALAAFLTQVAERRAEVPCVSGTAGVEPSAWTSTNPADIRRAKAACRSCPLLAACAAYAEEYGEEGGVWGGRLRVPREQLKTLARARRVLAENRKEYEHV